MNTYTCSTQNIKCYSIHLTYFEHIYPLKEFADIMAAPIVKSKGRKRGGWVVRVPLLHTLIEILQVLTQQGPASWF